MLSSINKDWKVTNNQEREREIYPEFQQMLLGNPERRAARTETKEKLAAKAHLAKNDARIGTVAVGLLSALQDDNGPLGNSLVGSQPITQAGSVQGKKCCRDSQGVIPQPKGCPGKRKQS